MKTSTSNGNRGRRKNTRIKAEKVFKKKKNHIEEKFPILSKELPRKVQEAH